MAFLSKSAWFWNFAMSVDWFAVLLPSTAPYTFDNPLPIVVLPGDTVFPAESLTVVDHVPYLVLGEPHDVVSSPVSGRESMVEVPPIWMSPRTHTAHGILVI